MPLKILLRQNIRTYLFVVLLFVSSIYVVYEIKKSPRRLEIIYWKPLTPNITCYYTNEGDALPSAENESFTPKSKAIFFHETSCRGGLNSRQACAVETAARAHPRWHVYVLFNSPVTEDVLTKSCLADLLKFQNIRIGRVHIFEYIKETPLKEIFSKTLKYSKFPVEHASDILRFVTLNKWGGVYLDLDMIVMRSLDSLPSNWIVKQSDTEVATGIMAFAKDEVGRDFTEQIIKNISQNYMPTIWAFNGPDLITNILHDKNPQFLKSGDYEYDGIVVYSNALFYPVYYNAWNAYYVERHLLWHKTNKSSNKSNRSNNGPYTHHMWNNYGRNVRIEPGSMYALLAKTFCPTVYGIYGHEFGA